MCGWRNLSSCILAPALLAGVAVVLTLACRHHDEAPTPTPLPPHVVDALPKVGELGAGWTRLTPGGDTVCSEGSPYSFFVRPAKATKLLVYLQGGGGCWSGTTCDVEGQPSFRPTVGDTDPASSHGIFELDNPENPFADYSMVYVPYCSGDVHLGDRDQPYSVTAESGETRDFVIHHRGYENATTVLEWAYRNLAPEAVFVTGSSAGSIPSPYYAHLIAQRWPSARLTQLGDGSGGYRGQRDSNPAESWGTLEVLAPLEEFAKMPPAEFNYPSLYLAAAKRHPSARFASYDTAEDAVQKRFLELSGRQSTDLQPLLDANLVDIHAGASNFHAFVAGGDVHTILGRAELYTYRVGDVRFRDWLADLEAGKSVNDVHCGDCSAPELVAAQPAG